MNKYRQIREKLYDILVAASTAEDNSSDPNITQNMGVAMSNAFKKGGVVNVISQNIVIQKVCPKIVDLLQFADQLEHEQAVIEVKQIEYTEDPIERCCEHLFDEDMTWKEFRKVMKERYFNHVNSRWHSSAKAALFLDVSVSLFNQTLKKIKEDYEDSRPDV